MTLSLPLTAPTEIGAASVEFVMHEATASTISPFTGTQQVFNHGGEYWKVKVTIPTVKREDGAAAWKAFLAACRGQENEFLIGDPDYSEPVGNVTVASFTGSQGDTEITLDSSTGNFKAGDYFQLGGGSSARLYMMLEDTNGAGTYSIWPRLREDYSSDSAVLDSPKGVFRLATRDRNFGIDSNSVYSISFEAVEVL